ncbi:15340_t:CDS:2, partial [Racocetra fulgida]
NLCFTPDGNSLLSPVGNRLSLFDLVNKDGALFIWKFASSQTPTEDNDQYEEMDIDNAESELTKSKKWIISSRHYFNQSGAKLGQLLVWEWQSESYVLKQQGHYYDMNTLSYSSDGQNIATGGDDGKVKVWNTMSGFCFVTFSEHTSGVSVVEFAKNGHVLFSASLDGTVRAFDLIRYRNFRTFTSPSPVQFTALAVDPSGEIVCAGSMDTFEVFVWSVQTGKLLDIMAGHEGPISGLAFNPTGLLLASSSWDATV